MSSPPKRNPGSSHQRWDFVIPILASSDSSDSSDDLGRRDELETFGIVAPVLEMPRKRMLNLPSPATSISDSARRARPRGTTHELRPLESCDRYPRYRRHEPCRRRDRRAALARESSSHRLELVVRPLVRRDSEIVEKVRRCDLPVGGKGCEVASWMQG